MVLAGLCCFKIACKQGGRDVADKAQPALHPDTCQIAKTGLYPFSWMASHRGLNGRIPVIIPIRGRGFVNQGPTLVWPACQHTHGRHALEDVLCPVKKGLSCHNQSQRMHSRDCSNCGSKCSHHHQSTVRKLPRWQMTIRSRDCTC